MTEAAFLSLKVPFTMVVAGQTQCGKTQFVAELIKQQNNMFDKGFSKILFCYSMMQPIYGEIQEFASNIEFCEGFPDNVPKSDENMLIIIEDMNEVTDDIRTANLFTKMRHANISTIFITQNLFYQGKHMRNITRNAMYIVLFPNFRDRSMISTLGRQIWPKKPKFLETAFEIATTDKPYHYLFIDLKPTTPEILRVRDCIFPHELSGIYIPQ